MEKKDKYCVCGKIGVHQCPHLTNISNHPKYQPHKSFIPNFLITLTLILMLIAVPLIIADALFGAEVVTDYLAGLIK